MNVNVGRAEIGQWYTRADKGEAFQVVGYDERARTIEIQTFGGDVDEIDDDAWAALELERSEPPENFTGPLDDIETGDLGFADTEMKPREWSEPLQTVKVQGEPWEETVAEEERDALGEGASPEPFIVDLPEADEGV